MKIEKRFLIKAFTTFLGLCRISLINSSHKQPSYWTSTPLVLCSWPCFPSGISVCNLHNHEKGHFACSREKTKMHCKAKTYFLMNHEFHRFHEKYIIRIIEHLTQYSKEYIFCFSSIIDSPRQFLFSCQEKPGRTIFTLIFPFIGFPWDVDWAFSPYIISHHESLNFS